MAKYMSIPDRFFEKVKQTDSCWMWTGAKTSSGYGSFGIYGKQVSAHVFSYEMHHGEIPKGMFICHSCDVKLCVNPDHLWIGTPKDNAKDMFDKGKNGWTTKKRTHCRNGHDLDEVGTKNWIRKNGKHERACLLCIKISRKKWRETKKANKEGLD